ncbi:MAG: putative 26S proteasome regulatory subunit [Lichina confinis]|nr:MAG: putative 26S proteasome regulatory subunit [Lichina confinis]
MSIFDLMDKKEQVEAELKSLTGVLDSHGVAMDTPLLTDDGFPRDDIDVAQIRITRARAIHVQNDYKGLLFQIEQALHEHYASASSSTGEESTTAVTPIRSNEPASTSRPVETPFAMVNEIFRNSPAERAGLMVGDRIRRFGNVDWINHEKLSKISEVVQQNEGEELD